MSKKVKLFGNAIDRSRTQDKTKITICGTDIPIENKKMYTVFGVDTLGKDLLKKYNFSYIDYFVDMLVFRNHLTNFATIPLIFDESIYKDLKDNGELSVFWQKDDYELRTLLKRFKHKEDAKKENDPMNLPQVDMTRPVIAKNKSYVVKKLMEELGLSRQIARKYVKQIQEKTETRIFNFTVNEIYSSILEMKGL